jgi:hypothetical protein
MTDTTPPAAKADADIVVCDACPVRCRIRAGTAGACDRYANADGALVRVDPLVVAERVAGRDGAMVPFLARDGARDGDWDGALVTEEGRFVTGIGAGTTYPDYKPAPFIVASRHEGVDMVTVVTEGIFSYCGVKLKIDTDRHLGPETATVRANGEPVGHVTTSEYGSQMLALGGVRHLTGGGKREGQVTCETMLALCNRQAVTLTVDGGSEVVVQAGQPPVVDGTAEERMRVGCGSATIGMFAPAWAGQVDEVVVVDDHITGVLSEHEAGRYLGIQPTGIHVQGRKSTAGRYFRVAEPGGGWGGTTIDDPLAILGRFDERKARPGLTMLMVSTTGEDAIYYVLDEALQPQPAPMPVALAETVALIRENCEPALCSVLFMAGAGGSLRAGVTRNPVRLTRSVKESLVYVSCGGAPVFVWPGGGITLMVDVMRMPERSFGYVPTPALVAPIEFTMRLEDYRTLGGHMDRVVGWDAVDEGGERKAIDWGEANPWPFARPHYPWSRSG